MRSKRFTRPTSFAAIERLVQIHRSTSARDELVDVNEWQIAGIKEAIASMDRGECVAHEQVEEWVQISWRRKL